jgi:hypothetical protein
MCGFALESAATAILTTVLLARHLPARHLMSGVGSPHELKHHFDVGFQRLVEESLQEPYEEPLRWSTVGS